MAANEKSLSIVVKARDEASAKIRAMNQDIKKSALAAAAPFVAAAAIIATASKAIASGFELSAAKSEQAGAQMKGDMIGALEAQIKMNDAWGKFGASIPGIGGEIERIIRTLKDTEGIKAQIEGMKQFKAVSEAVGGTTANMERQTALLIAQIEGASKARVAQIKHDHDWKAGLTEAEAAYKEIVVAEEMVAEAAEKTRKAGGIWGGGDARRDAEQATAIAEKQLEDATAFYENVLNARSALRKAQGEDIARIEKEEAADAEKARADLEASITTALSSELEKRVIASEKAFDDLIAKAKKAGLDTVALEKKQADETVRIRVEAQERADAEIKRKREEQARKAMAAIEKQRQELAKVAQDSIAFEDIVFDATHTKREQDLRDLDQWLKKQRSQYAGNQAMLAKAEQAGLIRKAQIEADALERVNQEREKKKPGAEAGTEVEAFTSRFLSRAPGREKPAWVRDVTGSTDKQTKAFQDALDKLGTKLAAAFLEQRPEVGAIA